MDYDVLTEVQKNVPTDDRATFDEIVEAVNQGRSGSKMQIGRGPVLKALSILEERGDVEERNGFYQRRVEDPIAKRL